MTGASRSGVAVLVLGFCVIAALSYVISPWWLLALVAGPPYYLAYLAAERRAKACRPHAKRTAPE